MSVAIVFKEGKCQEALEYYCKAFDLKVPKKPIRYCDFAQYDYPKDICNRIYRASIDVYGNKIYMYDAVNDSIIDEGNNVRVVIETSEENVYKAFSKLKSGSKVLMVPQKINNRVIATLIDKYNICRQFISKNKKVK